MSDTVDLLSKNLEQQQDTVRSTASRKKSLDRLEMMKFLENIIQEEDQHRYQQSFQNDVSSAVEFNLSPQSHGNTPTPFNNNNSGRSFSRSNSITNRAHKDTTLNDGMENVVINFQYNNRQNSIRIMDEERERLKQLIRNENDNIPPMFMQKREQTKQAAEDEAFEPQQKSPKTDPLSSFVARNENTSKVNSPRLKIHSEDDIVKMKSKLMLLETEKELNMSKIKMLGSENAEKSALITELKQNEQELVTQINKDKVLIEKLIKEMSFKDKQNFILAQKLKK